MLDNSSKPRFIRGFKKSCEEFSLKYRKELGLAHFSFLPARDLADHLEVAILSVHSIPGLSEQHKVTLLTLGKKPSWSAVAFQHDGGRFIIVNDSHSPARQESNIMHELAHIIRGHKMEVLDNRSGFPGFLREYDKVQEQEAEWLGSCLQIPREGLVWAALNRMPITELENHFHASRQMVMFRLNKEGILRQFSNYRPY